MAIAHTQSVPDHSVFETKVVQAAKTLYADTISEHPISLWPDLSEQNMLKKRTARPS